MLHSVLGRVFSFPSCKIIAPANVSDQKTIIVIGCARGGTSMVAGLIRKLGIFMGENIDGPTHEDQDFRIDNLEILKEAVNKRNSQYPYWGWKNTDEGVERIRLILPYIRNPHIIVVFRNFFEVAESFRKHENIELAAGLQDIGERYALITQLMAELECPVMMVNYDTAIYSKMAAAKDIASFIGIKCSKSILRESARFINKKGGYMFIIEPITLTKITRCPSVPKADSQPIITTLHNAIPHEKGYLGTENDPQIIITRTNKASFGTTVILKFIANIKPGEATTLLYYSACTVFVEQHSEKLAIVQGVNIFELHFSAELKTLRIDPIDSNGYFEFSDIEIYNY